MEVDFFYDKKYNEWTKKEKEIFDMFKNAIPKKNAKDRELDEFFKKDFIQNEWREFLTRLRAEEDDLRADIIEYYQKKGKQNPLVERDAFARQHLPKLDQRDRRAGGKTRRIKNKKKEKYTRRK
jgi:hypothetical protein